jgi:uncharacterized membrane protein
MGFFDAISHLLNFIAPAAAVALGVVLAGKVYQRKNPSKHSFVRLFAINFVVCALVLLAGLWFFGRDGKMLTYAALVVASATVQWVMLGLWRK